MKIKTNVKAGYTLTPATPTSLVLHPFCGNHNQSGLPVKTRVKAGERSANHNQGGLAVKTRLKAGIYISGNHNQSGLLVKTRVKAGALSANHNQSHMRLTAAGSR